MQLFRLLVDRTFTFGIVFGLSSIYAWPDSNGAEIKERLTEPVPSLSMMVDKFFGAVDSYVMQIAESTRPKIAEVKQKVQDASNAAAKPAKDKVIDVRDQVVNARQKRFEELANEQPVPEGLSINVDPELVKRDSIVSAGLGTEIVNADCTNYGVLEQTALVPAFNCSGNVISQTDFNNDIWKTQIKCVDCGVLGTNSTNSPNINPDLAQSATCSSDCCPAAAPIPEKQCRCPADRIGNICQYPKAYTCNIVQTSPKLCKSSIVLPSQQRTSYDLITDETVDKCEFDMSKSSTVKFTYRLNCKFDNTSALAFGNFGYWVSNGVDFATSSDPLVFARSKVFNFYRLSDGTFETVSPRLSASYLLGQKDIEVNIDLAKLVAARDKATMTEYALGGRVYFEMSLFSLSTGLSQLPFFPTYITIKDGELPRPIDLSPSSSTGTYIGIAVAILVVVLISVYCFIQKKNKKQKLA